MLPADLMLWGKGIAVFGGVIIGIYAVFSPSYVWFKQQRFGWGGAVLCFIGTVLILASIFRSVTLLANTDGLELRLAELQAQVAETKKLAASTNQKLTRVADAKVSKEAIADLKNELQRLGFQVTAIDVSSKAALTGLRNIDARIQAIPAVEKSEPRSNGGSNLEKAPMQKPLFEPAR